MRQVLRDIAEKLSQSSLAAIGERDFEDPETGEIVTIQCKQRRYLDDPAALAPSVNSNGIVGVKLTEAERKSLSEEELQHFETWEAMGAGRDVAPMVGALPASESEVSGSLPCGTRPTLSHWAPTEIEATTKLAVEMVKRWPTECKAMTLNAWRLDVRVGPWAAANRLLQREQFELVASILLRGLQQGRDQPRPAELANSRWPPPLQLISLWAAAAIDQATTAAEVHAVGTMLQSASVKLGEMELAVLIDREKAAAARQIQQAQLQVQWYQERQNPKMVRIFKRLIGLARSHYRNATAHVAVGAVGGRRGVGHAQWASMRVLEALAARFERLCTNPPVGCKHHTASAAAAAFGQQLWPSPTTSSGGSDGD